MIVIRKRQMELMGDKIRRWKLKSVVLNGYVEGRRTRGRQLETFMSGITRPMEERMNEAGML